jgi:hypothetical protein
MPIRTDCDTPTSTEALLNGPAFGPASVANASAPTESAGGGIAIEERDRFLVVRPNKDRLAARRDRPRVSETLLLPAPGGPDVLVPNAVKVGEETRHGVTLGVEDDGLLIARPVEGASVWTQRKLMQSSVWKARDSIDLECAG